MRKIIPTNTKNIFWYVLTGLLLSVAAIGSDIFMVLTYGFNKITSTEPIELLDAKFSQTTSTPSIIQYFSTPKIGLPNLHLFTYQLLQYNISIAQQFKVTNTNALMIPTFIERFPSIFKDYHPFSISSSDDASHRTR